MTEQEWLAGTDPAKMLTYLLVAGRRKAAHPKQGEMDDAMPIISDRKLRLFATTCCRQVPELMSNMLRRQAVEIAEKFADGLATRNEVIAIAMLLPITLPSILDLAAAWCLADPPQAANYIMSSFTPVSQSTKVDFLLDIMGNPFRPITLSPLNRHMPFTGVSARDTVLALAHAAYQEPREMACGRCGGSGDVPSYTGMYRLGSDRCPDCGGTGRTSDGLLDPDRLAVLADALEESGCECEELLRHLRGWERCAHPPLWGPCYRRVGDWHPLPGPHCRGCHVVDLILGKE